MKKYNDMIMARNVAPVMQIQPELKNQDLTIWVIY